MLRFTALAEVYFVPCLRADFIRMRKFQEEVTWLEWCPGHLSPSEGPTAAPTAARTRWASAMN